VTRTDSSDALAVKPPLRHGRSGDNARNISLYVQTRNEKSARNDRRAKS